MSTSSDDVTALNAPRDPESFDWFALHAVAVAEFTSRIRAVEDWSAPTPDDEWDTRALVLHVVKEILWVPHLLAGGTPASGRGRLSPIGSDLVAEWERHSAAATAAWSRVRADAPVTLSYDTVTAADYLREHVSDITIHSWDLARATGSDERLDETLVAAVWSVFAPQKATLEASGLFASPRPVDGSAPLQSRLLALTGRDDRLQAA